jgi:uncharacterized membrane-anchored protein
MIRFLPARILAAAVLLTALLVGLVLREDQARRTGREALLPMEAVDPRGLLTGHYVALRISQTQAPGQPCPPGLDRAEWLALALTPRGDRVVGGAATREAAAKLGPLVIKGSASCLQIGRADTAQVDLDIGVRRFHIDQKQALAMEAALRNRSNQPAYAVVSVGQDGKARLKGVIIAGQRAELGWF